MKLDDLLDQIEQAWAVPEGVLYRLRQGEFDKRAMDHLVELLRQLEVDAASQYLPKRMVRLLWMMPIFVEWQNERVAEQGGSEEDVLKYGNMIYAEIQRLMGIP